MTVKDQYCGDINDFRKYGLLRRLLEGSELRASTCWMLTPDDGRTDGKHIGYLQNASVWRPLDSELFDGLREVVTLSGRAVRHVEAKGLLPRCSFHSELVPDQCSARTGWFARALAAAAGRELVFFDPDNGLEVPSVRPGQRGSSKYLYWHEVEGTWSSGHSVLIYQHFPREKRDAFTARMCEKLLTVCTGGTVQSFTTANVVFLLSVQAAHTNQLRSGIAAALDWCRSPTAKGKSCDLLPV